MKDRLDISFVVLSWNSASFLRGCLDSIERDLAESSLKYEVFVIDNGSRDGSLELLYGYRSRGFPIQIVPLGTNTGTTFSRNIGLRLAIGKYICVLDSDILFCQSRTIETLIAALERLPQAGIIAPMLQYPSGNHQKSYDRFPTATSKLKRLFFLRRMEQSEGFLQAEEQEVLEVDYVISAFWLFERALVDLIGLLDEAIFYAPEDVDFCLRSWLAGRPVVLFRGVKVVHQAQEISRRRPISRAALSHLLGLVYYFRKYGYIFRLSGLYERTAAAVAVRRKSLSSAANFSEGGQDSALDGEIPGKK